MDRLHLLHLIFLSVWAGVVAAEFVLEIALRKDGARLAAEVHYFIDLLVEGPLLVGILVTGGLLLERAWPPTPLHWIKIGAALIALTVNGWCVGQVIARRRHADDPAALARYQRRVFLAGAGAPFGLVAAYIGFAYFMG